MTTPLEFLSVSGKNVHNESGDEIRLPGQWVSPFEELGYVIGDRYISRLLLPAFAEQFRDMNETDIDKMMASFAFENCQKRTSLEKVIKEHTQKELT